MAKIKIEDLTIECIEKHVVTGAAMGAGAISAGMTGILESSWCIKGKDGKELEATGRDHQGNPTGLRFSVVGYADEAGMLEMVKARAVAMLESRGLLVDEETSAHPAGAGSVSLTDADVKRAKGEIG